jgi:GDP-L-fucose synthase
MSARFDLSGRRVWVAGATGMVGSAVLRQLAGRNVHLVQPVGPRLDLRRQSEVEQFMSAARPEIVILAAAKVGGILANSTQPADFLYDNLMIQTNVIEAARQVGVAKLLALGSTCIYPRDASQPMREDALLTGPLEATNQWYAIAKIAAIKQCQAYREQHGCDFISAMPTNLYGPNDNFDLSTSHVLPALIRKVHEAKVNKAEKVVLWGTGAPRREFMHVDELARALVFLIENYSGSSHVNIGTGTDSTIADVAELIARVVGFTGRFEYDTSMPDGTPRKCIDITLLRSLGFEPNKDLEGGIRETYAWYQANGAKSALA